MGRIERGDRNLSILKLIRIAGALRITAGLLHAPERTARACLRVSLFATSCAMRSP
nr:hypothetical protein [Paraburkholderia sp.]